MNDLRSPETLATIVNLIALCLIMGLTLWGLFKSFRGQDVPLQPDSPETYGEAVEVFLKDHPWPKPIPKDDRTAYQRWRDELLDWSEKGGQEELETLLERWRGIPHEKPKPVVGVDLAKGKDELEPMKYGRGIIEETRPDTVPYRVGQWVRRASNKKYAWEDGIHLWLILKFQINFVVVMTECGELAVHYDDIEPAFPRIGEWWKFGNMSGVIPFKVTPSHEAGKGRANLDAWARKGEMIPVNFGIGEEAKD